MNSKMSLVLNTLITVGVASALLIAATRTQQYTYYTFLRWLVMSTSSYFCYQAYKIKRIGILIFFINIAIIFNPIKKIWFQKETWHLINFIVATAIILIIIYEWINLLKATNCSKMNRQLSL